MMTDEQKNSMEALRKNGLSYARVAAELSMSPNTVKSFFRRLDERKKYCRNCGKLLEQTPKQKPKTFCCDWCRTQWWKMHHDQLRRKAVHYLRCAGCGKSFVSYKSRDRKYCSHECYIMRRFGVP
jgi:endogenous inhibitor of DNA gyrase (YacG/DUF329 family)